MEFNEFVSPAMDPDYIGFTAIEIFMAQQQGKTEGRDETLAQVEGDK